MKTTNDSGYPALLVLVPVAETSTFQVIAKEGLAGQGLWIGFESV